MASLTARYRDFSILAGFLLQLWLYGTPVIYALRDIPSGWRTAVLFNPMTMPVETFKYALLGAGTPSSGAIALSIGLTVAVLGTGLMAFRRIENTFVDAI
jgi:lipopolysaccharide transport system permease protein